MQLGSQNGKDKEEGAIAFASSYFFRRILAFEEATRKGSHAKKKKEREEIGGEKIAGVKNHKREQDRGNTTRTSLLQATVMRTLTHRTS